MQPEITHVIEALIADPPAGARCISVKEAVVHALRRRPQSYGLSTEYALRRYRAMKRQSADTPPLPDAGAPSSGLSPTDAMWAELAAKVDARMAANPAEDDFTALEHVLSYDAPSRYFLSPVYAEKLFYRRRRMRRRKPRSGNSQAPVSL